MPTRVPRNSEDARVTGSEAQTATRKGIGFVNVCFFRYPGRHFGRGAPSGEKVIMIDHLRDLGTQNNKNPAEVKNIFSLGNLGISECTKLTVIGTVIGQIAGNGIGEWWVWLHVLEDKSCMILAGLGDPGWIETGLVDAWGINFQKPARLVCQQVVLQGLFSMSTVPGTLNQVNQVEDVGCWRNADEVRVHIQLNMQTSKSKGSFVYCPVCWQSFNRDKDELWPR